MQKEKEINLTLPPNPIFLHSVQVLSEAVMRKAGAGSLTKDSKAYNFVLAVDEIITNILKHGLKKSKDFSINIKFLIKPNKVTAEIKEEAPEYNPPKKYNEKLVLETSCGIGLHLVRTVMDEYKYYYDKKTNTNIVILTLNL